LPHTRSELVCVGKKRSVILVHT